MTVSIIHGDCREVLAGLEADSFHACVTDPPAGIGFMGRTWDTDRGGRRQWVAWMTKIASEVFRVCKPGAHALVWSLPRTSHWTGWAWEDAGWVPRDCVYHLFGSGFPKSLDVSKAIDRNANAFILPMIGVWLQKYREKISMTRAQVASILNLDPSAIYNWERRPIQAGFPTDENWERIRKLYKFPGDWDDFVREAEREIVGAKPWDNSVNHFLPGADHTERVQLDITAPATEAAREWQGWGTALKPAAEQWWLFRKPLSEWTVAANVLRHGTGALNIDASRVGTSKDVPASGSGSRNVYGNGLGDDRDGTSGFNPNVGRWPANVCHSGEPEVMDAFARFGERDLRRTPRGGGGNGGIWESSSGHPIGEDYNDTGTAARFFFCAKADASERVGSHPTIKPVALMEWLVRLVCPPSGRVLDPFAGTGSTLVACDRLGFDAVGIEQDAQTVADAHDKLRRMRARRMIGDREKSVLSEAQLRLAL